MHDAHLKQQCWIRLHAGSLHCERLRRSAYQFGTRDVLMKVGPGSKACAAIDQDINLIVV